MRVHIIWPDDRWVSEETIHSWYRDAFDDGHIVTMPREVDTVAAIYMLNHLGIITSTDEAPKP